MAPLSLIEIEDLYESRRVLESMLAGVGTERISERGLNQLNRILDMQETAVKSGNPDRFADLDREFHFVLYRAAGYARAFDITQTLRDASERYVRFYTVYKGGAADSPETIDESCNSASTATSRACAMRSSATSSTGWRRCVMRPVSSTHLWREPNPIPRRGTEP